MSNLTAGRGSAISQHLRATQKILQDGLDVKYVWGIDIPRRGIDTPDCRIAATLDAAEVKRTNEMDVWIATDT